MINGLPMLNRRRVCAIWDSPNFSPSYIFSNAKQTAIVNTSTNGCGRATLGKSSGKWSWEFTCTAVPLIIGILDAATNSTSVYLGGCGNSCGVYSSGIVYNSGAWIGTNTTTFTAGDVIRFELDMTTTYTCYVFKNNVQIGSITGLSGYTVYPAIGQANDGTGKGGVANFGASPFVHLPTAGYNRGVF